MNCDERLGTGYCSETNLVYQIAVGVSDCSVLGDTDGFFNLFKKNHITGQLLKYYSLIVDFELQHMHS